MVLTQHITLQWHKDCRGGSGAVLRSRLLPAARLPKNYFDYIPFGIPVHRMLITQRKDGFHTEIDERRIEELDSGKSLRLSPAEMIRRDGGLEIRYRYDWHCGAAPRRLKYDPSRSGYVPLNELAMELGAGDYGRVVCNGRFVDYDTGAWWYETTILNVMLITDKTAPLDCFLAASPNRLYEQLAWLR